MVELQVLSKILNDKSMSILTKNGITDEYFVSYSQEYHFIKDHYMQYHNVPDKETFCAKFPDFHIVEVTETERYLVDTFNEEHLYSISVPILQKVSDLLQTDSRAAVEYLQSQLPALSLTSVPGVDIIKDARYRLIEWEKKKENPETFCIPTGFKELDEITGGWQLGEEFAVFFARTGNGKTWIMLETLKHAWKLGKRVGLIEPEMSAIKTGYRFDTLNANVSNTALLRGNDIPDYSEYIKNLETSDVPFIVAGPKDFKRNITVSKLRSFIIANDLDILGIDGISYLADERKQKGDNRTTQLTNISEDLMDLSIELGIPIIVVCQSNREGAKDDDAPDLENIRDSDGIAYNASIVIALRQKGPGVEFSVRKNRNGKNGDKLTYMWDIDRGVFTYVPDGDSPTENPERVEQIASEYKDGTEVF